MMIGELAARSGLAPSHIRFYEANGLLPATRRRKNGYREFNPRILQVLEVISVAQDAGFTLDEIRPLLPTDPDVISWNRDKLLESLRNKVCEIEILLKRRTKNKAQLLAIIDLVENKPADLDCVANSQRVAAILRQQTP
jgi:DNA-binding transcriptional MerR regulator